MAKKSTADSQVALFNGVPQSLDLDSAVRRSLQTAFREGSKSRQAIADDMSRLMGQKVTVSMLDHFTANSHPQYRFPAAWLPSFCVATGDCEVMRLLVEGAGYRMATFEEAMLIDYARATLAKKNAMQKIEELEGRLRREPRDE